MKKHSFTGFSVKMLLLFFVIAIYVNVVYFPLDKKIKSIDDQRTVAEDLIRNLDFYKANIHKLDERISQANAKIDEQKLTILSNPLNIDEEILAVLNQSGSKAISIKAGDKISEGVKSADGKSTLYKVNIVITLQLDKMTNAKFVKDIEKHKSGAFAIDSLFYSASDNKFLVNTTVRYFEQDGAVS